MMPYEISSMGENPPNWPRTQYSVKAIRKKGGGVIGIPVLPVNVLVTGTTGYGKTTFTKEFVRSSFYSEPHMYGVFFQIKPDDFTAEFLRPQDKVITFNQDVCQGCNLFKWNLVKEIRSCPKSRWETELEALTSIQFSDALRDPRNRIWADGAKATFKGFVRVILYKYRNNPSNSKLITAMRMMDRKKLLKFLAECDQNLSMLKDNFEFDPAHCEGYRMPKRGSDIFFFLQNVLEKFGGTFMSEDGDDTIYDYMKGRFGERLFILHDHKARASSKLFERYFLKYIGDNMLSLSSDFHGKMLWVLDEIDKVEHEFGLTQAVTLGRQFGLQVLVSTQSINSLYAIAPEEHGKELMDAALAGFPMTVTFHPGDPYTIETMQRLYGKTTKQTLTMPLSRYDKPTFTTELRYVVEDSDFASLDTGECYVKYRSEKPERVKILI